MKYFAVQYGHGVYIHNGKSATVVGFETREEMSTWVDAAPSRKKIPSKQYVRDSDGKNVHVMRAAVPPSKANDVSEDSKRILIPEMEDENDKGQGRRSKR